MYKLNTNQYGQQYISMVNNEGHTLNIPFDPANSDYQEYLEWVADGNEPEPADEAGEARS